MTKSGLVQVEYKARAGRHPPLVCRSAAPRNVAESVTGVTVLGRPYAETSPSPRGAAEKVAQVSLVPGFVPCPADTDAHVERHRERVGPAHLLADERLEGLPLPLGDLQDELVVDLQEQA